MRNGDGSVVSFSKNETTELSLFHTNSSKLIIKITKKEEMQVIERMKTKSIAEDIKELILPMIEKLEKHEEVVGIVLLSGMASNGKRYFADKYSDVDMTIFLDLPFAEGYLDTKKFSDENQDKMPAWLPEFEFYLKRTIKDLEINLHQSAIQIDENPNYSWTDKKKEAYLYTCDIIYDPKGRIEKLIKSKCEIDFEQMKKDLIRNMSQIQWYGWFNPETQLMRGFPWHSHLLLNKAIDLIIDSVYQVNKILKPHDKWKFEMSKDLQWTPYKYDEKIKKAILISDYTEETIIDRIELIKELYNDILNKMYQEKILEYGVDPFYYTSLYISKERQLQYKTPADKIWEKLKENFKSEKDERYVKGIINYFVIEDAGKFELEDFEELQKIYTKMLEEKKNDIRNY